VQAALQHTLSAQRPEAQSVLPPGHACPLTLRQLPAPSHALVPLHAGLAFVSASPCPTGVVHVPVTHE
jgi:hypothetical protein